jgi:hypothetical protein
MGVGGGLLFGGHHQEFDTKSTFWNNMTRREIFDYPAAGYEAHRNFLIIISYNSLYLILHDDLNI